MGADREHKYTRRSPVSGTRICGTLSSKVTHAAFKRHTMLLPTMPWNDSGGDYVFIHSTSCTIEEVDDIICQSDITWQWQMKLIDRTKSSKSVVWISLQLYTETFWNQDAYWRNKMAEASPRTQSHPSSRPPPPCWRDTRCPRSIPDPSCAESDSCRGESHDLINSIIHQTPQKQTEILNTVTLCQLYHQTHQ